MLSFFRNSKLPVSEEQRAWVDSSFPRLCSMLGRERMTRASVLVPTPECFPDPYDGSRSSLLMMFNRVTTHMGVSAGAVELEIFCDTASVTRELAPLVGSNSSGAGGLYFADDSGKIHIAIHESKLGDPLALVATIAHELGHVVLLASGLVHRDEAEMEPLTDLLTVFLGLGVFNANASFRFSQYTNGETQGWSTQRSGYLSEEVFGYALARFAQERREHQPAWAAYLSRNVKSYFKRSTAWLAQKEQGSA